MNQKGYSSSLFWARQIALAVVLMAVAGIMIYLLQSKENEPVPVGEEPDKSVSKGLSDFYREFRMTSSNPLDEDQSDFVLDVDSPNVRLDSKLERMSSQSRTVDPEWKGERKYRTFKEGSTLREAISGYADAEGMQLIWDLDQDFIVKHQFQIENTVAGSLAKIATAIDSSFEGEVNAYLCAEQHTLVVTAQETEFLKQNCVIVTRQ